MNDEPMIQTPEDRVVLAAGYLVGRIISLFARSPTPFSPAYYGLMLVKVDPEFMLGFIDQLEALQGFPLPRETVGDARHTVEVLRSILAGEQDDMTNLAAQALGIERRT